MVRINWFTFFGGIVLLVLIGFGTTIEGFSIEKERVTNGFYNSFSIRFMSENLSDDEGLKIAEEIFNCESMSSFALYDITNSNSGTGGIIGVLIKNYSGLPQISTGRFFDDSDFFTDSKVAVIGDRLSNNTYMKDEKQYIDLFGVPYNVIGVLKSYGGHTFDSTIYYNFDSMNKGSRMFQLDGPNKKSAKSGFTAIEELTPCKRIDPTSYGINRIFHYDKYNYIMIVVIGIIIIVVCAIEIYLFFINHRRLIKILYFLAMKRKKILLYCILNIVITYIALLLMFYVLSTLLLSDTVIAFLQYFSLSKTLIYSFGLFSAITFVEAMIILCLVKKESIVKRGRLE